MVCCVGNRAGHAIAFRVGEELATRVEDVFRLNGVEAVVTVVAAGEAQVSTGEADEVMLQRVVEQARTRPSPADPAGA